MRIIVTDTGNVWNHENPYLEQFKEIVIVVCLNGKQVTDQYECFVVPHAKDEDEKSKAMAAVAGKLNSHLGYHDDVVFLTDDEPSTLYPFYALRKIADYNSLHLVTMSPWEFEVKRRIAAHNRMLADLSELSSLLYYDSANVLESIDEKATIQDAYDYAKKYLGEIMLTFMNGIYNMTEAPCYFDFSTMQYIPLDKGFEAIHKATGATLDQKIDFKIAREYCTLGLILPPIYPNDDEDTKQVVERPVARLDGKKICNILREQRLLLAKANGIPFDSEQCTSIGPCAGTCEKCDMESGYLREQLQRIPESQRIYPHFDTKEEMQS